MHKDDTIKNTKAPDHELPEFARPSAAVDSVIYTVIDNALCVLLVKRSQAPFAGEWALVGGFVDLDQDQCLMDTAKRKLAEKTGVHTPYLEQFSTIGNRGRDPRGWSITTVYFALIPSAHIQLQAGKGASDIRWSPVQAGKVSETLAFDHAQLLADCTTRLRNKVLYTSLPVYLMPSEFTLNELQSVYEIIIEKRIDPKSFRRRLLRVGILEETGNMKQTGRRPAVLYRLQQGEHTHFFVRSIEGLHE